MYEWAKTAGQYATGFGKGVGGFVKDTAEGVKDLAVGGYKLTTDAGFREQAWETTKAVANTAKKGMAYAVENPRGAVNAVRDTVSSAYGNFQAERDLAIAQGRVAEFDAEFGTRATLEILSPAKLLKAGKAAKLGKAADLIPDANKLEKVGLITDKTQDANKALTATEKGSGLVNQTTKPLVRCPLTDSTKKPPKGKATAKPPVNNAGKATPKSNQTPKAGEPISMVTGEELLELEDFVWDGPLMLNWTRFYRTAQSGVDLQLGHGWLTPLDEWLDVTETQVAYHDREGRTVEFPIPELGGYSLNLPEQLRLYREEGRFRLTSDDGPELVFASGLGRCRLTHWQNETGQSIELVYGETGQVKALVASWGKALVIQREGQHIIAISPARPCVGGYEPIAAPWVRYQYDAAGDLVASFNRLEQGERYAYQNHVIIRRSLASGFNFHFEWDRHSPEGRCIHNWGDGGVYDTRFEWTDSGLSRAIDSRGGVSEFMHDNNALLLWETSPEGRTTRYAYDTDKLLHTVTDPAGHATRYEYDEEGRIIAVTDPLGHAYRLDYNPQGKPVKLTDPLGQIWQRSYDTQGRITQTQDPQGGITRIAYNALGLPAQILNALGQTRTLLWDEHARLVGETGFDQLRRSFHYDAEDRLVAAVTQDKLATRYQYDAASRVIAVQAPDGGVVRLEYNAQGLVTKHIAADGKATEYRYGDGLTQITERIDPASHVLRYRYDSERNLVGLVNAKGEQYHLGYDKDENLTEETGFDGRVQRYHYGADGQLDAYAQRSGEGWQLTRFQRDPLGRLLKKTLPEGSVSEYTYDPLGRLQSAHNSHSVLLFQYNALGQVTQENQSGETVRHEYDALGNRVATVTPDGRRIDYQHDAQGRVQAVLLDGEALSRHKFDELGQETARQQGKLVSRYDYDPAGRLLNQQAGLQGSANPLIGRRYAYDTAGRLAALDDLRQGTTRYLYDPADRLARIEGKTPESFVHDPAGNLVGINQATGGLVQGDRLILLGDRHFAYDDAGNLIEERRGTGGQLVTRYQYDGDNRLIQADTPQGTSIYRYDPLGRRVEKHTTQGKTRFTFDGARLLTENRIQHLGQGGVESSSKVPSLNGGGMGGNVVELIPSPNGGGLGRGRSESSEATTPVTTLHLFEPDSFRPLARIDRNAQGQTAVYHYHLDHLGTPCEMTDAQGRIVWSATHRAHGSLALADIELIDNNLRFQGQYFDSETGLHYNLNRYYDPSTGRFIHQDPIGLEGGENLYEYAPNPVNWVDPFGYIHEKTPGYNVYGLYAPGESKPYYIGITDDLGRRSAEHRESGRLTSESEMRPIKRNVTYGTARGIEQANIEHHGTKTARIGTDVKHAENYAGRGNKVSSFDHNNKTRIKSRQEYFENSYRQEYSRLNPKGDCG